MRQEASLPPCHSTPAKKAQCSWSSAQRWEYQTLRQNNIPVDGWKFIVGTNKEIPPQLRWNTEEIFTVLWFMAF